MRVFHVEIPKIQNLLMKVCTFEKTGEYQQAFDLLGEIWTDKSQAPDVGGLPSPLVAETLLRCGAVIGYLGNLKQILDAQEISKNLVTAARNEFLKSFKYEKLAECENFLASAYYRTGEFKEAHIWIEEALSHKLTESNEIRLHSHIIKSVILLAESKFQDTISYLKSVSHDFDNSEPLLKGCFCTNLALAHKNIGFLEEAIRYLTFARFSHKKSGHRSYLATVENNLAQVYKLRFEFPKALDCADRAIELFSELGDRARKSFSIDTKAQICIAKKDFTSALDLAEQAIEILKFGDNAGMLSEVYLTKSQALVGLGEIAESVFPIAEAVSLAKLAGYSQVKQIADSFELSIYAQFPVKTNKVYSEKPKTPHNLSLELPPEILPNQDFFGIWIKNKAFEKIGLRKGNLAIGAKGKVSAGDLVAVCDRETDLVTIGFFENQYGLICLENLNREPELLDEYRVTIMGKIVGYAEPETNVNDCYEVKPILPANLPNDESDYLMT